MGQVLLTNNAYTTLSVGCASGDTTITVSSSATFPAVLTASGNWFYACLQDTFANLEIVKVTNVTGTVWTVTRAIGGTTARAFVAGSVVELRVTAETLSDVTSFSLTSSVQNSTPQYITSVAGTNTITGTLPVPFTGYAAGQKFHFLAAATNTGAATLNLNSLGAQAITKGPGTTALAAGDLQGGQAYEVVYDGTGHFQLIGAVALSYTAANDTAVVHLVGNETVAGVKTFSSMPVVPTQSLIRLNTVNGYGSTDIAIRRWLNTTLNQGTDITYADSATLGGTFTINVSGVYAISYTDTFNAANSEYGVSLNSASRSVGLSSGTATERLVLQQAFAANAIVSVAWAGYLVAGSVIRAHTGSNASGASPGLTQFTIGRVA